MGFRQLNLLDTVLVWVKSASERGALSLSCLKTLVAVETYKAL